MDIPERALTLRQAIEIRRNKGAVNLNDHFFQKRWAENNPLCGEAGVKTPIVCILDPALPRVKHRSYTVEPLPF